jgi:hypothetical protein
LVDHPASTKREIGPIGDDVKFAKTGFTFTSCQFINLAATSGGMAVTRSCILRTFMKV